MTKKDQAAPDQRTRWRYLLKMLVRSGSWQFARHATTRGVPTGSLAKLRWRGHDVFYRPGTSDMTVLYQILFRKGRKAEYYLPRALNPSVILDIGSNIGASILYFRHLFPKAKIFGFEPHPETFELLRRNVAHIDGVAVYGFGLGAADKRTVVPFSGVDFAAFNPQTNDGPVSRRTTPTECEIRRAGDVLQELGIATVDLIKIDCEGAEQDIFDALPDDMINRCKWIVGELHDASAFKILARLSPHFDLDLRKTMFGSRFRFHGCNRACASELKGTFDVSALQT